MHQQVEDRLTFFEDGKLPPKNAEVMKIAVEKAEVAKQEVLKREKKKKKKDKKKKRAAEDGEVTNGHGEANGHGDVEMKQEENVRFFLI
jgi:hypothetical protein